MKEIKDWKQLTVREIELDEVAGYISAAARSYLDDSVSIDKFKEIFMGIM